MNFTVLFNQILVFSILISVGIFAIKFKIINNETKDGIARFVIDITMPLLIFFSLINMEITTEIAKNGIVFIFLSYLSTFLLLFSAYFIFKRLSLSDKKNKISDNLKQIFVIQTVFGNCVFFGFPFFDALFPGGIGLFYAILYYTVQASVLWTLGIFILDNKKNNSNLKNNNKFKNISRNIIKIVNPNTIAFILGLVFLFLNISFPTVIESSLGELGKTSLYLSMIYIGATLGEIKLRPNIFSYNISFIISLNKMLIIPIIMLSLLLIVNLFFPIDSIVISIIVLETGMPIMALLVVLAKKYNHNVFFATENLFISTVFSLISLPLLYFILSFFI